MFQRVYSVLDLSGWFGNPSMKKCSFLLWCRFDCGRLMNLQIWFADQNKQKNWIDSVSCMPSLPVLMSVMNYIFLCFYYWLCFPSVNTLSLLSICLISSFSESEGANLAITASFVNPISQNLRAWFIFRAGVKQKDQVTYTNERAPVQYCRGYFISAEVPVDVCRNVKCALTSRWFLLYTAIMQVDSLFFCGEQFITVLYKPFCTFFMYVCGLCGQAHTIGGLKLWAV